MSDKEEGGSRRAENYSQNEEIQVSRSWMHINHDPIVGADQNLREYTLRQTAAAATNLSSNLADQNKIAKEQNDRLADQTTLNLFEFAQKTNPSLASRYRDTYVELRMQEELLRVQQRMASQIQQQGGTPQQPVASPPPQGTQVSSLTQEGDEVEGEEDEEEAEEGGDDEEDEYAIEN